MSIVDLASRIAKQEYDPGFGLAVDAVVLLYRYAPKSVADAYLENCLTTYLTEELGYKPRANRGHPRKRTKDESNRD